MSDELLNTTYHLVGMMISLVQATFVFRPYSLLSECRIEPGDYRLASPCQVAIMYLKRIPYIFVIRLMSLISTYSLISAYCFVGLNTCC